MNIPLDSNTLPAWLSAFDVGTLTNDETVQLYQYLIDNYIVWGMGSAYTEMAEFLLRMGYCLLPAQEAQRFSIPAPYCDLHIHTNAVQCFWCGAWVAKKKATLVSFDPASGQDMYWCGCEQE